MSKKSTFAPSNLNLLLISCDRQKRFSQTERSLGLMLQKVASDFLIFQPERDLVMIFQSLE